MLRSSQGPPQVRAPSTVFFDFISFTLYWIARYSLWVAEYCQRGKPGSRCRALRLQTQKGHDADLITVVGRATAVAFAFERCQKIALCDRHEEGLAQTKSLIEDKVGEIGIQCEVEVVLVDVTREQSVSKMVNTIVKKWGRIDYVVNAAGLSTLTDFLSS